MKRSLPAAHATGRRKNLEGFFLQSGCDYGRCRAAVEGRGRRDVNDGLRTFILTTIKQYSNPVCVPKKKVIFLMLAVWSFGKPGGVCHVCHVGSNTLGCAAAAPFTGRDQLRTISRLVPTQLSI
jgi:hypothetical protein